MKSASRLPHTSYPSHHSDDRAPSMSRTMLRTRGRQRCRRRWTRRSTGLCPVVSAWGCIRSWYCDGVSSGERIMRLHSAKGHSPSSLCLIWGIPLPITHALRPFLPLLRHQRHLSLPSAHPLAPLAPPSQASAAPPTMRAPSPTSRAARRASTSRSARGVTSS